MDENPRLQERPNWDKYFVAICEIVKERSLDPNTQVGCVIVDKRNRIVSTGYNSYPPGCDDASLPFKREGEESKYPFIIHAEINSIVSCGKDLSGCVMYLPLMPCSDCFKSIITSGIKHIKYYNDYKSLISDEECVKKLAEMTGIIIEKIDVKIPEIIWK